MHWNLPDCWFIWRLDAILDLMIRHLYFDQECINRECLMKQYPYLDFSPPWLSVVKSVDYKMSIVVGNRRRQLSFRISFATIFFLLDFSQVDVDNYEVGIVRVISVNEDKSVYRLPTIQTVKWQTLLRVIYTTVINFEKRWWVSPFRPITATYCCRVCYRANT